MSSIYVRIKIIFISIASHLASLETEAWGNTEMAHLTHSPLNRRFRKALLRTSVPYIAFNVISGNFVI